MTEGVTSAIPGGVRIAILVQPRASRERFGPLHDQRIKVAIMSPPVDGAANAAVIGLLAKTFGVAKREVTITAGHSSRRKTVQILGVLPEEVERCIE